MLLPNMEAQVGPNITSWLQNTTLTGYGGYVSNVQLVQYSASYVYVTANCIPEYSIGPWPSDPNIPSPQNFVCEFPRNPVQNTGAAVYTSLGSIGLWSNGVAIFNAEDGYHWSSTTSAWATGPAPYATGWNRNALVFEGVSFDSCLGHPAPGGTYHNHVNPKCLYNDLDSTHHSPIIGYAFDGFPIYGCYGYASTTSASGPIKRMRSSYVLSTATTRAGGPPVTTYPMGDCCEDYIYTAGYGDLDDHNGRFCYTPEYPAGTYAYFVTLDSNLNPAYPLVLGPSYYGVLGSNSTHITPVGPDTTYTTSTTVINNVPNITIKYKVVPNPVEDYAYIYMDAANMNNVRGSLYDAQGRLVRTISDMQPTIAYSLNMIGLQEGIYTLVFEGNGVKVTEKIMKK